MLPLTISYREKYEPAMRVTDSVEAKEYFRRLVQHSVRCNGLSYAEAEKRERVNLRGFASARDIQTQARVSRLYMEG